MVTGTTLGEGRAFDRFITGLLLVDLVGALELISSMSRANVLKAISLERFMSNLYSNLVHINELNSINECYRWNREKLHYQHYRTY